MRAGVVIPVGPGREENLMAVLACLARQTEPPQAIVTVHDGPEAASPPMRCVLRVMLPEAHRPGLEQPRNAGVRALRKFWPECDAVWFLDSDVIVGDDCYERLSEAWDAGDPRVLIGPYDWLPPGVREPVDDPEQVAAMGGMADPRRATFKPPTEVSRGKLNDGLACFSGNLVWPIDEFVRIGGYWNDLHHGRCEDGELGLRAVAHDVPISFAPEARGWHLWHPINQERNIALNTRDVPMINARHPWVEDAPNHVFVVERDGRRFDQLCPVCGTQVNTLDFWQHMDAHELVEHGA